jgi:[ribosomal protein S5]-alanine N-acetyltransferase
MKYIIETPCLWLREYTSEDAADVLRLNSDADLMRFANKKPAASLDEALDNIAVFQKQYVEHGYGRWAVILKTTGEHVGYCGLKYRNAEADPRRDFTDIGYRFERPHWKSGFATEAARACLEYGFETLDLQRIVGCAPIENKPSIRVLERIGLQFYSHFLLEDKPTAWYQLWKEAYFANKTSKMMSKKR